MDTGPNFSLTSVGTGFLLLIAAAVLYGITCVQTLTYFKRRRENESKLMQAMVTCLWILDTVHMGLMTFAGYFYLVVNFADISIFLSHNVASRCLTANGYFSIVSGAIVISMFCWRVWILSRHNQYIVVPMSITATFTFVSGCALVSGEWFGYNFSLPYRGRLWVVYTNFSFGAGTDFLISFSLCYLLMKYKRLSVDARTDYILTTLMKYAICTALLTSSLRIACFIAFTVFTSHRLVSAALYIILGRLYLNSLLTSLNARKSISSRLQPSLSNLQESYLLVFRTTEESDPVPLSTSNIEVGVSSAGVNRRALARSWP